MNFLAHLHIANACQSSLLGNLLGDFIKGNPEKQFPDAVAQGIRLHRFVDAYTDHHPMINEVKPLFAGPARRFAAIALDVFWDHCLSCQWQDYHAQPLNEFCRDVRQQLEQEITFPVPERFVMVNHRMWQSKWLESYGDMRNIELALNRMSLRSERMHALQQCYPLLESNYPVLRACFDQFYPLILSATQSRVSGNDRLNMTSFASCANEAVKIKNSVS
ncbi:acyl carrier protein phosphodiesterase [Vibrio quintilis]|uniref:Acyl carrier protein phosphodiesterase n=1 Tax=Vibrio quintilis TaxID=1117707 RepID=A0A1M7YZM4_9VIBR|nr:ACP phosphodiesterase [Vibrio quintilis]SHO58137.1 Acyl carrier protein phosphodiesterase [Vibrio quintilis]